MMSTRWRVAVAALGAVVAAVTWLRWSPTSLPPGAHADLVVVRKAERTLSLYRGGALIKAYTVSLGSNPVGPKQQEGDGRTPEGRYVLDFHKRDSSFHRALHVSYPSPADIRAARAAAVSPGGQIMVHGLGNGLGFIGRLHTFIDWTNGCIAVTDAEIEEIYRVVPDGTPIHIEP